SRGPRERNAHLVPASAGRLEDVVSRVPREHGLDDRVEGGSLLVPDLYTRAERHVRDRHVLHAIEAGDRQVLRERIARAQVAAEALLGEVVVIPLSVVDVEARPQWDVEEVRLGESDETEPALGAEPDPQEYFLAAAEQVPLAHVQGGEQAVEARV